VNSFNLQDKELETPTKNNQINENIINDNDKYRKYTIEVTGKTNYLILNRIKQALEFQEKYSNFLTQAQKSLNLRQSEVASLSDENGLVKFLEKINMLGYLKTLQDNGINSYSKLLSSNKNDLILLNISNAHTNKLWNEIELLKKDALIDKDKMIHQLERRQSKRLLNKRENSSSFTTTSKKPKL
jgi:hypothetical protein